MSSNVFPAFFAITPDSQGPYAVVVAFCSIFLLLPIAGIRFGLAIATKSRFGGDDAAFALCVAFAFANALCIYRAVVHGLGAHVEGLGEGDRETYYKLIYAGQITGLLSLAAAKTSVIFLFRRISPNIKRLIRLQGAIVGLWFIFSLFAIAFQCQLPQPWVFVPGQCSTGGKLEYVIVLGNMATDVMLSTAILPIIWGLNTTRDTRVAVMMLFGSRLIVVLASIGLLVSVATSIQDPDQPWASLSRSIWDMIVILLSAITATVPRTNTFWQSLQSGKSGVNITNQEYELSSGFKSGSGGNSNPNTWNAGSNLHRSGNHSRNDDEPRSHTQSGRLKLVPPVKSKVLTTISSGANDRDRGKGYREIDEQELVKEQAGMGRRDDDDGGSQSSDRKGSLAAPGLNPFGIYQKVDVRIEVEHAKGREGRR